MTNVCILRSLSVDLCLYHGSHLSSHAVVLLKLISDPSSHTCPLSVLQRISLYKLHMYVSWFSCKQEYYKHEHWRGHSKSETHWKWKTIYFVDSICCDCHLPSVFLFSCCSLSMRTLCVTSYNHTFLHLGLQFGRCVTCVTSSEGLFTELFPFHSIVGILIVNILKTYILRIVLWIDHLNTDRIL